MITVTQVLSKFSDFSTIREDVLLAAQERGKIVHAYCAAYAKGEWIPSVQSEYEGYFKSFKDWFDGAVSRVHLVEQELFNPTWQYGGHPDLLCTFKNDHRVVLIDLKTPRTKNKAWPIQIAAYYELIMGVEKFLLPIRAGSLRLHPDGKPAQFEEYTGDLEMYFNVFLSCLNVYNYFYKE